MAGMIQIELANQSHIAIIRSLAAQVWPVAYAEILSSAQLNYMLHNFYSDEALLQQMFEKKHSFYIAYDGEKNAVGFVSFSHQQNSTYKLEKLYVLSNLKGLGVGKQLLNFVINEVKKLGANSFILNVNRHNKALDFYLKSGFKITHKEDIAIGNNYFMNDFVMEMKLT